MELMIAKRIKKYRKDRDMIQETLAQVFGVPPQSISKWECGDGYPDITLLPSIANYFEITVDELIGIDQFSAEQDVKINFFNKVHKLSHKNALELAMKYHKKYPRNWHVATTLMWEITRHHRDKLEEYKPLLNEICERILKDCTDVNSRRNAVHSICMICPEDEVPDWLNKLSRFWNDDRLDVFEERSKLMGDEEKYWMYRYAGNFIQASHAINRLNEHKSYVGKPNDSLDWNRNYIKILDAYSCREATDFVPDGWLAEYSIEYRRLSAAFFGLGDRENGYHYLEKSLELNERWAEIPDLTPLALGNPLLFGDTKILKNKAAIQLSNGKAALHLKGIHYHMHDLAEVMTAESGWEWFDCVRGEERWLSILESAKAITKN